MICNATTIAGRRCTRYAAFGRVFCNQHDTTLGWNPRRVSEDGRRLIEHWNPNPIPEVPPVPAGPRVAPALMAGVLKASEIPHSYRRMLAVEFCEAFAEADTTGEFDPHGFLAAADVEAERRV